MTDSEAVSPNYTPRPSISHQPSVSPALLAQDSHYRQHSYSASADQSRQYGYAASYSHSAGTSPAFGPINGAGQIPASYVQTQHQHGGFSTPGSALTSPALGPQNDMDHEATAALLMLNSDRRTSSVSGKGAENARGLSVKELLSG